MKYVRNSLRFNNYGIKKHYGNPYHNAYSEIKKVLKQNDFEWIQGSTYATEGDLKTALLISLWTNDELG